MKQFMVLIGVVLLLTGCASSGSGVASMYDSVTNGAEGFSSSTSGYDGYSYEKSESYEPESDSDDGTVDTGVIDVDKLVYRGSIEVTSEDFDGSLDELRALVKEVDGFIENESVTDDDYSYSYYIDSDSETRKMRYTATVRVPSSQFSRFMDGVAGTKGRVVRQSQNVDNISQQYSTAQTSLEIYQIKYDRYKELLKQAYDINDMIRIEDELTELEIKLADYKTRLSTMDTDVAYSYVDIVLRKVAWYEHEIGDSFGARLWNTCKDSLSGVLKFLEGLLFFLIMYVWYLVPAGVAVFLLVRRSRHRPKKSSNNGTSKWQEMSERKDEKPPVG